MASAFASTTKDPNDVVDFKFNWSDWLTERGSDTISSATFIVDTGLTKDSESNDTTSATVMLSGGTAGTTYTVTCRITTAYPRTVDRSIDVHVLEL